MLNPTVSSIKKDYSSHLQLAIATVPVHPPIHEYALKASLSGDDLSIDLIYQSGGAAANRRATFSFSAARGDVLASRAHGGVSGDHPPYAGLTRRFMGLSGAGRLDAVTSAEAQQGIPIFSAGPAFVLTPLNQYYAKPLAAPFFVTDAQRSYFVDSAPSTTTVFQVVDKPSSAALADPFEKSATAAATSVTLATMQTADSKPWTRANAKLIAKSAATETHSALKSPEAIALFESKVSGTKAGLAFLTIPGVSVSFTPFFHPFAEDFALTVRKYGMDRLFTLGVQAAALDASQSFKARYAPVPAHVKNPDLVEGVDFGPASPFGPMNRELFLEVPLMLQALLSQNGYGDEGLQCGAWVCNLLGVENDPADAWNYLPFHEEQDTPSFAELLDALSTDPEGAKSQAMLAQIESSQLYPFQPFRIARLRPDAMKKYAFLQGFNTRFDRADSRLRRYTPEFVDMANADYLALDAALGRLPEILPAPPVPAKTYAELLPHLDAAGDAVLTIETKLGALSTLSAPVQPGSAHVATLKLAASRYFCVPVNPKLLELWEKVADRLYKIRNGLTIDGERRPLGLFGPKKDPAALVQAVAGGANPEDLDLNQGASRPHHLFPVLVRVAKERIDWLGRINNSLLQAREKGDAEDLAARRAQHELEMATYIAEERQAQIDVATQALQSLAAQREAAILRWRHYREQLGFSDLKEPATDMATGAVLESGQRDATREFKLVDGADVSVSISDPTGTIPGSIDFGISLQSGKILAQEREEVLLSFAAAAAHGIAAHLEAVVGVMQLIPEIEMAAKPMGAGAGVTIGPKQIAGVLTGGAREIGMIAGALSFFSSNAGKQASFVWREREFVLQLKSAAAEVLHIDQQIIGANKEVDARKKSMTVFAEQTRRNGIILDFLSSKFSRQDLYLTLANQLSVFQKYAWSAARASLNDMREAFAYHFSPTQLPPLAADLSDAGPHGLLSADALMLTAHALESAYMKNDERRLALTRTFSLKQINPVAFLRLRETGHCEFSLPKAWWDFYDPGHFDRRIVDVYVSVPCTIGPDIPLSATIQLLDSQVRDASDNVRPIVVPHACSAIVTSSGREDDGAFHPDRFDDHYRAFQGGGGESSWSVDLPVQFRLFPYRTMADLRISVRLYAQRNESLVQPAADKVAPALNGLQLGAGRTGLHHLVSARFDMNDDWYRWEREPGQPRKLVFTRAHLPFPLQGMAKLKGGAAVWAKQGVFLTEAEIDEAAPLTIAPRAGDPDSWDLTLPPAPSTVCEDAYLLLSFSV